jgi:hypothetical protein
MGRVFRTRPDNMSSALQLRHGCPDEIQSLITRALKAQRPDLGEDLTGAAYLAASFIAYAEDKHPELAKQWRDLLLEVLSDAGTYLDEDENEASVQRVIDDLIRKGILEAREERPEEGSVVMALLTEDEQ